MTMWHRLRTWAARTDRGSISIELAILAPAILALLVLIVAAGRVSGAHAPIDSAANNAARAASIARTPGEAHSAAMQAATSTLSGQGKSCPSPSVTIDTSGIGAPAGQVGVVRVSVTCTATLSDLVGLPLPGSRTTTAEATSVVDAYRSRSTP